MKIKQIVGEHKKGVRAMKYTKKPQNTIAPKKPQAHTVKPGDKVDEDMTATQGKIVSNDGKTITVGLPDGTQIQKPIANALGKDPKTGAPVFNVATAQTPANMGQAQQNPAQATATGQQISVNTGAPVEDQQMGEESEQFHSDRVSLFGKINRVIQSIQTPEQYANALGFVKRAFQKLNDQPGGPEFSSKTIQRINRDYDALERDLADKARELGIEPQRFLEEGFGQKVAHGIGNVVKKVAPEWVKKQQDKADAEHNAAFQSAKDKFTSQVHKVKKSNKELDEGHMGEIAAMYDDWMSSEDAPFDDMAGDDNAVWQKAREYLFGKVPRDQVDNIAELLTRHFNGDVDEGHADIGGDATDEFIKDVEEPRPFRDMNESTLADDALLEKMRTIAGLR